MQGVFCNERPGVIGLEENAWWFFDRNVSSTPAIVVIDDDELDASLIEESLRRLGFPFPIHRCLDGAEALEYFGRPATIQPALVVLDIQMPRVGGIEVLRQLKSEPRWRHLPVVMLTNSGEEKEIAQCYELGCLGCIRKPPGVEGFVEMLKAIAQFAELLGDRSHQGRRLFV